MIGAGTVVAHAATELREDKHHDVVRIALLAQIIEERRHCRGHFRPQLLVSAELTRMRVIGAVIHVEDPSAQVGIVDLRDAAQPLTQLGVGIGHRGVVALGRHFQNVGTFQRVQTGLAQIVHHFALADHWRIGFGKTLQDFLALLLLDARQHAVVFQRATDTRHRHASQRHRPEHALSEAHARDHIFFVRIDIANHPTEPTFRPDFFRLTGVPNVHGAEVGAR